MRPAHPDEPRPHEPQPIDAAWAHRDDLLLYARRLLGGQGELAEDVVQEAFLRLHERLASGAPVREARPWLFRVTRNLALDERRRRRRGLDAAASLTVVAAQPKGPLELLQGREEAREALEGLGSLPPRERDTVLLEQAGLEPTAIARRMQTSTNAVHQSLFRARRRMRDGRAAVWGLLPLPLIRLLVRAASSPSLDRLPALAPGSGGRLAGGAGMAGIVAAAVIGGSAVVDQPLIPHASHARTSAVPAAPAVRFVPSGQSDAGREAYLAPAAATTPAAGSAVVAGLGSGASVPRAERRVPDRRSDRVDDDDRTSPDRGRDRSPDDDGGRHGDDEPWEWEDDEDDGEELLGGEGSRHRWGRSARRERGRPDHPAGQATSEDASDEAPEVGDAPPAEPDDSDPAGQQPAEPDPETLPDPEPPPDPPQLAGAPPEPLPPPEAPPDP